jgi:hypothetical protein
MAEDMDYRGHHLLVSPVGKGWRALIFAQGAKSPLPESPVVLEKSTKEEVVAQAKRIVDARFTY